MNKEERLELSTRLSRADAAGVIEALVEGLKEGHLKVQKSGDALEMPVPRVIDLDVTAFFDSEKASMQLEVSWRTNRPDIPDDTSTSEEEEPGPCKTEGTPS